jgi:hypothetical protein
MSLVLRSIGWVGFLASVAGCGAGAQLQDGSGTASGAGGARGGSVSSSSSTGGGGASSSSSSTSSGAGGAVSTACGTPIGIPETVAQAQGMPYWVAVDASSIYWSNFTEPGSNQGALMRVGLDGGAVTTLVPTGPGAEAIGAFTVGATGIYWTAVGSVMRAGLDGSGVTTLASGQSGPGGLAVDAHGIYWVNAGTPVSSGDGDPAPGTGSVMKANLDGSGLTVLASGLDAPSSVAVDATSVYWTNQGTEAADYTDGTVMKVGLDGQGQTTLASSFGGRFAGGIAVDAASVYWVTASDLGGVSGAVYKVGLDGQGLRPLVTLDGLEGQLAIDAESLYFNASATNLCDDAGAACEGVLRSDKNGDCLTVLASGQDAPWGIAVDARSVYWANNGQLTGSSVGTVTKLSPK